MAGSPITIEGLTPDDLLAWLNDERVSRLLSGKPIIFQAGSARVLGQFAIDGGALSVELAHIDGGGEGVLPTLVALADRYARKRGLARVEWHVYATNCAKPNPKLRRVLERRGFTIREVPGKGECYCRTVEINAGQAGF